MKKKVFAFILTFIIVVLGCSFTGCTNLNNFKTQYNINCEYENGVLTSTCTVNYYNNTENAFTLLKFNLYGNAFRKDARYSPISSAYEHLAYPNGKSYGDMQITKVLVDEKDATFSIGGVDQNILLVNLQNEVFPDERCVITIEYTLNLANVVARTGVNDKTINLANFYPILCVYENEGFYECVYYANGDPFYSECADYLVTLTFPSEYVVAHTGNLKSSVVKENKTQNTYSISNARSFALVLSKEFECISDNSGEVLINYFYYKDENPLKSLEYAVKSIETFNKLFGKYPYSTYSVVQTKFVQGGMEFPTLVMVSDTLEGEVLGEVIVHETAHQWWQTAVGNNEIEYGFVDEGLTEYSVVLFFENNPEYNFTRQKLIKSAENTYHLFFTIYDRLKGGVDTTMIRSLKDFSSEYEYVNIAYVKGCLMYDTLRDTIGDDMFFKGLKQYYSTYCFKNVTPYEIVSVYEKLGADANGFFNSYYEGKVLL